MLGFSLNVKSVCCLVSVVFWLVWALSWNAQVLALFLGQRGEFSVDTAQMESCNLLVEVLWQNVDLAWLVFAVGVVAPELNLGQGLVGETV